MRKGYTVTYQMRKKQRQQREIVIQYVLKFVGVVLLAFLLVRFVCFSFTIQGDSMSPTIERGEKHLVNRLIYQIKGPSRYDVVIFKSDDKNGNYYVKRVIGLPGEKVQIKNGRIYVNGKKTKAFSSQKILSAGLAADEITLKSKQYFVVGITIIIVKIPEVRVLEISKEQISLERSVSNTGRGKQREGEIKNGFSVVPGSYDQSKTYDAGKHETDRYYDRTCGCKNSTKQQKSGY